MAVKLYEAAVGTKLVKTEPLHAGKIHIYNIYFICVCVYYTDYSINSWEQFIPVDSFYSLFYRKENYGQKCSMTCLRKSHHQVPELRFKPGPVGPRARASCTTLHWLQPLAIFVWESWTRRQNSSLLELSWECTCLGESDFSPLCIYPQMTGEAPRVLILGLHIHFNE